MPAARIRRFASAFFPLARIAPAGGPAEDSPAPGGGGGKVPVFGQEAIAGVDGVRAGAAGGLQDGLDVQIGLTRRGRPHANRRVSLHGLQAGGRGFGMMRMAISPGLATSRVLKGRACPVIRMLPEEESLDISANPSGPSAWRSPAS